MTLSVSSGGGFCCCADCEMFHDYFDCCSGDPREPRRQWEWCDDLGNNPDIVTPPSLVPCCLDQEYWYEPLGKYMLNTKPTQDLGGFWDWQNATGDWWKAISPDPLYSVYDSPCNDGALWALEPGTLECLVGWPNDGGYAFNCDIVNFKEDTSVSFLFFDPANPTSSLTVSIAVTGESGSDYTAVLSASISGGLSKTKNILIAKTNPLNPSNRKTIYVSMNLLEGMVCVNIGGLPTSIADIVLCGGGGGHKFSITTGGTLTPLDNVYWGKVRVYSGQEDPRCPACHKCYCSKTVDGTLTERLYGGWKMKVFINCLLCGTGLPCSFTVGPLGFSEEDPDNCNMTGNQWVTDPFEMACGGSTKWFRWRITCMGNSSTIYQYVWTPDGWDPANTPDTGRGSWSADTNFRGEVIPSPDDCRNYSNHHFYNGDNELTACLGVSCFSGSDYHVWEDDGTGTEPA